MFPHLLLLIFRATLHFRLCLYLLHVIYYFLLLHLFHLLYFLFSLWWKQSSFLQSLMQFLSQFYNPCVHIDYFIYLGIAILHFFLML